MDALLTVIPQLPPGDPFSMLMGDGPAALTTPGGWQNKQRPRKTAMTTWDGQDPISMAVPIIIDEFFTGNSVEGQCNTILGWLRNPTGPGQPPVLKLSGPVPLTDRLWVLNDIAWTSEERRESDGQRTRVLLTLTFLEYVPGEYLVSVKTTPAAAAVIRSVSSSTAVAATPVASTVSPTGSAPAPSTPPSTWTYTVRSGDTLASIAQKQLLDATKWGVIADMNGIRDPRSIKVGQVLKMPAPSHAASTPTPPAGVVVAGHGRLS